MGKNSRNGFSFLELITAVAVIFILAALAVPSILNHVYAIRIRYSAVELSGLLQSARMESVRKNSFYSLQQASANPFVAQVIDSNGVVINNIPKAVMAANVNVFFGPGSGAPSEAALVATLNFAPAPNTATNPSFNSRGLPCIPAGVTCPLVVGQGFVFFLSRADSTGNDSTTWTAVAVTPSGRCQVWMWDGATWTQL